MSDLSSRFNIEYAASDLVDKIGALFYAMNKRSQMPADRERTVTEIHDTVYYAIERAFNAGFDTGVDARRGD